MIISCPNCNKQFKIDNSQIPDEGRDLQCGSCNNIWYFKNENEKLKPKEEIDSKDIETIIKNNKEESISKKKQPLEKNKTEIKNRKKENISEKQKTTSVSRTTENKETKFFSYLVVFIISFVAFIILLDTIKKPLINVFPEFEVVLFNLFETLQDIKLFIIDLI